MTSWGRSMHRGRNWTHGLGAGIFQQHRRTATVRPRPVPLQRRRSWRNRRRKLRGGDWFCRLQRRLRLWPLPGCCGCGRRNTSGETPSPARSFRPLRILMEWPRRPRFHAKLRHRYQTVESVIPSARSYAARFCAAFDNASPRDPRCARARS